MTLNIKKLIEAGIKDGKDTEKMLQTVATKIDSENSRVEIFEGLYKDIYGNHLCDDFCVEMVAHMKHGNEGGQKWTLEETNSAARKVDITFSGKEEDYTEREFWAAMHMMYYDYGNVLTESGVQADASLYAKLADAYLADEDAPEGKLSDYFFFTMKHLEK